MDVDLNPDRASRDAVEGECLRRGEHGGDARSPNPTCGAPDVRDSSHPGRNGHAPPSYLGRVTIERQRIGRRAEDLVAERLAAAGWEILGRNARTRYGELDVVALDGRTLVFVEVKAGRSGSTFGPERPVLGVDWRKQLRVRRLARAWLSERRDALRYAEIRFDAVGVTFDRSDRPVDVEHIKGAF
jgi:putative endonuclease